MSNARPNCGRIDPSDLQHLSLCDGDVLIELGEPPRATTLVVPQQAANRVERSSRCGTVVKVGPGASFGVGDFVWFNRRRAETFSIQHRDRGTVIYLLVTRRIDTPKLRDERGRPMAKREVENMFVPSIYAKWHYANGGEVTAIGRTVIVRRDPSEDEQRLVKVQDEKQEKATSGTVISVGHDVRGEIAPGDRVLFNRWAGNDFMPGGDTLLSLAEDEVLAVMEGAAE
jgi:co-chaperonin GroES (HSP10)